MLVRLGVGIRRTAYTCLSKKTQTACKFEGRSFRLWSLGSRAYRFQAGFRFLGVGLVGLWV